MPLLVDDIINYEIPALNHSGSFTFLEDQSDFTLLGSNFFLALDFENNGDQIDLTVGFANQSNADLPPFDIIFDDLDFLNDEEIAGISASVHGTYPSMILSGDSFSLNSRDTLAPNGSTFYGAIIDTDCFLTGTRIGTARGEVRVEELNISDLVDTADGNHVPIKWVGRQTVDPSQVKYPIRSFPVLVKAGALGHGQPSRDLYVSPNHSLLVDGLLINAGALVNHVSILRTEPTETFVYYHIELEEHALLIADGARAESFFPQKEDRRAYDNWAEYEALYPHGSKLMLWPLDYPRISSTNKVPRYVRQNLLDIAHQLDGEPALLTA